MSKATTTDGSLQKLAKCYIVTPTETIWLKVLPEITDSKTANYVNETVIGRSNPVINYSHSEPRMIGSELTFIVTKCQDIADNLRYLRIIESLVYPGDPIGGAPYTPPPICKFYCGQLLDDGSTNNKTTGVCCVLKSYSFRAQSDVSWDVETYLPYKFTISCQWEVVTSCSNLPTYQTVKRITSHWYSRPGQTPRSVDRG